jgi:dihydrolipoamide dehydrogenase
MGKTRVAVIGSGPGGYVAAIRAAQLGAEVTLVEKDNVGGTCLNRGCIPTKCLLRSVEALLLARKAGEFGVVVKGVEPDFPKIMARKQGIVVQQRRNIQQLVKSNGITLISGNATLVNPHKISVQTKEDVQEIETDRIIIATGSEPIVPKIFDSNHPAVLTSNGILELKEVPKSLLILGAGVIGVEFATVFSSLGTAVTMVEMMEQIIPTEDKPIAMQMRMILEEERGIKIFTGTKMEGITNYGSNGITAKLGDGKEITAEKLLVSIGRQVNSKGIGLENAGVALGPKGNILANEKMETNVKGIYAIGDVIGKILLAHVASTEGIVAAENATGGNSTMDYSAVPSCIYTMPEIASVGLTADKAKAAGKNVKVGKFNFGSCSKAVILGEEDGFVSIVADHDTDKVLGAQIIGPHATDLISELALAVRWGMTAEQVGATIHPHPTLTESVMEAAHDVHGKTIHKRK